MKSTLTRRLEAVESALGTREPEFVVIRPWFHDSDAEVEDKLARWLNGEDFEGVRSDIRDRRNAKVFVLRGVSPAQRHDEVLAAKAPN